MKKVLEILRRLLRCPLEFPLEALMGLSFFLIAAYNTYHGFGHARNDLFDEEILLFFVPLFVLTYSLHQKNKWAYIASFFIFPILMPLSLESFMSSSKMPFLYVLAALLLVLGTRRLNDRPFGARLLHLATQLAFGVLVTGILYMAILAITWSFFYIFGIKEPQNFYLYVSEFLGFVVAPLVCVSFVSHDEYEEGETPKILQIIINFILTPAIIIYTVILYAYTLKILFTWDLPKGGVAWMVMGFITAALVGRVAQSILSQRYYDWFYGHFTFIAIPPLVMYWIGSIYRIRLYSFTESRFYLMVAGVLMTLFVLMLWKERTRRFQLMALIFGAAIILFTYIPGISAKSIGLSCQKHRLVQLISGMKLADAKTGKLNDEIEDMRCIQQDSLLCEQYKDVTSVINYVRHEIGIDEFEKQYGEWTHSEYNFTYMKDSVNFKANDNIYFRKKPVELGEYTVMLPSKAYQYDFKDQTVTITQGENNVILSYPIQKVIREDTMLLHHPEQLLTYRNDSLMLVLDGVCFKDTVVTDVRYYGLQLFRKK